MPDVTPLPAPRPRRRWFDGPVEAGRFLFLPASSPESVCSTAGSVSSWFVPFGLAIGLLWAGVFRVTWRTYGETDGLRLIQPWAVLVLEAAFTGPVLLLGWGRAITMLTRSRVNASAADSTAELSADGLSAAGILALCIIILGEWTLIASIPNRPGWWPAEDDWRRYFNFLYPTPIYRPLLLAPLWGRWGILLAACVGRTAASADTATRTLCAAMRPARLVRASLLPFALSAVYFSQEQNRLVGIILGFLVFGLTYAAAVLFARRCEGQTRDTLFASGLVAQVGFLAVYRALWPLIHG